jgi:hypothetical protein
VPSSPRVWQGEAFEAGTKFPTARVVDKDGNVQVQANFSGSVLRRVYDISSATPQTAVLSNTTTIASVVFNTLQTWDVDTVGFNFQDSITSNSVAWEGGHVYRLSYLLPHTTQGYIPVVFDLKIQALLSL